MYIALLWLAALSACTEPALAPLPAGGTILAFGDSLTVGVGASRSESYPSILATICTCEVVNAGVSGEVTSEGLKRLPAALQKHDPDILILLEGGNDILRDVDPAVTKRNLSAMVELARNEDIDIVLVAVPARKLLSKTAPLYRELAEDHSLLLMDDLVSGLLRNKRYKSDPIHFNAQGYRVMAESIHALLVEQGAL